MQTVNLNIYPSYRHLWENYWWWTAYDSDYEVDWNDWEEDCDDWNDLDNDDYWYNDIERNNAVSDIDQLPSCNFCVNVE